MDVLDHEADEWEIARGRIQLREVIGTGGFGAVWRAALSHPNEGRGKQIVAAKCFTRKLHLIFLDHKTELFVGQKQLSTFFLSIVHANQYCD